VTDVFTEESLISFSGERSTLGIQW
jgi:hypothetical protein